MDAVVERLLSFAERLQNVTDTARLIDDFEALIQSIGFEHFIITGLPWDGWDFDPLIVATNFPRAWIEHHIANEYLRDDAVGRAALKSTTPFAWHTAIELYGQSDRARKIVQESYDFGLVDGIAFPCVDLRNRAAVVSIATDRRVEFAPLLVVILHGIIQVLYGRLWEIAEQRQPEKTRLTEREREVLQWLVFGKTLDEIALILDISHSTVRFHLSQAREKLGGYTLPQLVGLAMRERLI